MANVVQGTVFDTITITKGDTLVGPSATLRNHATREAVDLSASDVYWRMVRISDGEVVVDDGEANIDSAVGEVSYDWLAAHVDEAGSFAAWWIREVAGKREHYPSGNAYIRVDIGQAH